MDSWYKIGLTNIIYLYVHYGYLVHYNKYCLVISDFILLLLCVSLITLITFKLLWVFFGYFHSLLNNWCLTKYVSPLLLFYFNWCLNYYFHFHQLIVFLLMCICLRLFNIITCIIIVKHSSELQISERIMFFDTYNIFKYLLFRSAFRKVPLMSFPSNYTRLYKVFTSFYSKPT